MQVTAFDFSLPASRIALHPTEPRDAARMLVVPDTGAFIDAQVSALPTWLRAGDLLVLNDTRVIPAQLTGQRGQARIEVTLHRAVSPGRWRAFARPLKRLRAGQEIRFSEDFRALVVARDEREVILDFSLDDKALREKLERFGEVPLPPYIRNKRPLTSDDPHCYQTIYAKKDGAVAAPTAGLHFTENLFTALRAGGIDWVSLTLHVGAGTFLPISVDDTDDHVMHHEYIDIPRAVAMQLNQTRSAGGRIIAIGTTSLRALESIVDDSGHFQAFRGDTDIFIRSGHRVRGCDGLLTNFHLPRSTLFMLVAAFSGLQRMQAAYAHAIEQNYRFYSYGDACLLLPGPSGT